MINLRRRLAHLLARMTIVVDPDPPMKITTVRRIDTPITEAGLQVLADLIGGQIEGRGIVDGRAFTKGTGTDYAY
jgi:hypothetical protein